VRKFYDARYDEAKPFGSLQPLFLQALRRYGPSDALVADARRVFAMGRGTSLTSRYGRYSSA
jgi:hypothetical protein